MTHNQALLNAIPPSEAHAIISRVESMVGQLTGLLDQETTALKKGDMDLATSLFDRKSYMLRQYQDMIEDVSRKKEIIRKADQDTKARLESIQRDFSHSLNKNRKSLDASRRAVERLAGTIMTSIRQSVPPTHDSYTAGGVMESEQHRRRMSVKVNEVL